MIYDTRPQECRDFLCLWKLSDILPDWARPDRLRAVLVPSKDEGLGQGLVVLESYPGAAMHDKCQQLMNSFRRAGCQVAATCLRADAAIGAEVRVPVT
jgi:hypothetical protein